MEEINLKELFRYYLDRIAYIIAIVCIVIGLAFVYGVFIQKPKYQSSTSLILTGFSDGTGGIDINSSINNNDLTINQKLVTTYQKITTSRKVLKQVKSELKLDYSIEEIASKVTVTSEADTEIIKITVTDENAKTAYKIADEIANVFSEEVKEIYNVSNVSILDEAEVAKNPSNMGIVKLLVISSVLGIALAFVIIFIMFYFDSTIKSIEQIEERFDVAILGSIPNYNDKRRRKK